MSDQNIRVILRSIGFLYWFLFLSNVSIIVISAWYVSSIGTLLTPDPQTDYIIFLSVIVLLILLAPVSYLIPQRKINRIPKDQRLFFKLTSYRQALMIRFAAMNSAGFITAMGFILQGNTNLMYLQVIVILFFIIYRPTPFKIAADLDLEDEEEKKFFE